AFYDRVLGTDTPPDPVHSVVASQGTQIILYDRAAALRDMGVADRPVGGSFMQFLVDDADAAHARIASLGVPATPPVTYPWGSRSFRAFDPDGNALNFAQPPAPSKFAAASPLELGRDGREERA
ncbi:MAG: VOC family protein, partial [Clostridiales bacterium]|nr:VOC family protein [Clostridiales bacterium]